MSSFCGFGSVQINRNPKLMIIALVVAMIVGTLFSIVWSFVWPLLHTNSVVGNMEPPANASLEQRGESYRTTLDKAIKEKLPIDVVVRAALNYADWLRFEKWDYREAKKAYDRCVELCNVKDANGLARTYGADAMLNLQEVEHYFYLTDQGLPPDPSVSLAAQKQQIDAAKELGFTDDANDVQRQVRTQEQISTVYCDNKNFTEGLKYINQAEDGAKRYKPSPYNIACAMVKKARALNGLGKTAEADKLFIAAVKLADDNYGGGSDESENLLHLYSDSVIKDGDVERGSKIKQQEDDDRVW